jgi:Zn-dependent protease
MAGLTVVDVVTRALMLVIVFPAHELAHALVATRFGDPTPRAAGRLTLNPIKHLDLFGSLLFVIAGVGWATTPINPLYFGENRRAKLGLVGLSGPLTNLGLAVLGAVPFYLFGWSPALESTNASLPTPQYFFTMFVILNLLLGFFNLIPVAPLDGAQVLGAAIPASWARAYESVQRYGFYILIVILIVLPQFGFNLLDVILRYLIVPILQLLFLGLG